MLALTSYLLCWIWS